MVRAVRSAFFRAGFVRAKCQPLTFNSDKYRREMFGRRWRILA
ncbi:hypothetical protein SAMN05444172_6040 [Burkholderia sp. GAS332]|nr:hypothetical protein SAMN05444172_6040 [Burkholderia sp. GAS332]